MEIKNEYKISIGLLKSNMTEQISRNDVLKSVTQRLVEIGVSGFNSRSDVGLWGGKPEPSLNISFIDAFENPVNIDELKGVIEALKKEFDQQSILLSKSLIEFEFI